MGRWKSAGPINIRLLRPWRSEGSGMGGLPRAAVWRGGKNEVIRETSGTSRLLGAAKLQSAPAAGKSCRTFSCAVHILHKEFHV